MVTIYFCQHNFFPQLDKWFFLTKENDTYRVPTVHVFFFEISWCGSLEMTWITNICYCLIDKFYTDPDTIQKLFLILIRIQGAFKRRLNLK